MKIVLCLGVLLTSAVWADEAADRAAIEATVSALNTSPTPSNIFTADFPNAAELQRFREGMIVRLPADGNIIRTPSGTIVISREPMGEATWYPGINPATVSISPRFVTKSVAFTAPDTAVVVAIYGSQSVPVLFVLKREGPDWHIASFRVLPEAQTKAPQ